MRIFLLILFFLIPILPAAQAAVATSIAKALHVEAELISETQSVEAGKEFWLGVNLAMDSEWHTYWKFPGDAGLPTKIEWQLPPNFQVSEIFWPRPEKILVANLVNYGYSGEVLLLTKLKVPKNFRASVANIAAKVSLLVCKQECIPGSVELSLQLPRSTGMAAPNQFTRISFEKARNSLPTDWPVDGIGLKASADSFYLHLPQFLTIMPNYFSVEFFPESQGMITLLAEQKTRIVGKALVVQIQKSSPASENVLRGVLVVRSKDNKNIFPVRVNLPIPAIGNVDEYKKIFSQEESSLWQLLVFAFLGGLILNLMPCVLPVLGMKILSILQKNSVARREAQKSAWIYTFGVLVSFWILSAVIFLLRASGDQLGWGFQLQSPVFLLFLLHLFLLVAFHLLGKLQWGNSIAGMGNSLANKQGALGSFFTGVLAVVVASPCTAPFMGVALGAALLLPWAQAFFIFSFLGLGLAFPFLFFTYFPAAMKILPRPGVWMERLKKILSLPIFATVIWLLWVYSQQVSIVALTMTGVALVLISLLLLLRPRVAILFTVASIGIGILSIRYAPLLGIPMKSEAVSANAITWEKFSPALLESSLVGGRAVFIDFTAAWCLSCQVNERLVMSQDIVVKLFKKKNILALRADWTNSDPEITRALEGYGRVGVPLYVLYQAGKKEGEVLPQVLTVDALVRALGD